MPYSLTANNLGGTAGIVDSVRTFLGANGWTIDSFTAGVNVFVSRNIGGTTFRFSLARTDTARFSLNGYTAAGGIGGRATAIQCSSSYIPASNLLLWSCPTAFLASYVDQIGNGIWFGFGKLVTVGAVLGGDVTGAFVFGHYLNSFQPGLSSSSSASGVNAGMIRINNAGVASWQDNYGSTFSHAYAVNNSVNLSGLRPMFSVQYSNLGMALGWLDENIRVVPASSIADRSLEVVGSNTWLRASVYTSVYGSSTMLALKT